MKSKLRKSSHRAASLKCVSLILSLMLCLGLFSACGERSGGPSGGSPSESSQPSGGSSESSQPSGNTSQPSGDPAKSEATRSLFALDTLIDLKIYGDEALLDKAAEIIYESESRLSVTDKRSEIYALDLESAANISEKTEELLSRALELCERTDGAFDISIYPLVRAWGFTTDEYRVPGDAEIAELLKLTDYRRIREAYDAALGTTAEGPGSAGSPEAAPPASASETGSQAMGRLEDGRLALSIPEGMQIDLGGIAKGHIGQQIADMLKENGVESAILNLGGNIQTVGVKPDGSPWRVAVQDPFGNGLLAVMDIEDKAVITSGGYERFFEQDGVTYWHIIDPKTGRPADSGLVSATIVGSDGTVCDALSTACFILGAEGTAELWRMSDDFEAVLVGTDGEVYTTEGLADSIKLLDSYAKKDIIVIKR